MGHVISWEDTFEMGDRRRAGIALGSNVGDRIEHLRSAREAVLAIAGVDDPILCSPIYETEPVGTEPHAGSFFNAVIDVGFVGEPLTLLDALQQIEAAHGRPSKRPRNAPRTLDLDILYLGNLVLSNEEVVIPHPRLHQRRFVLAPLADIRPELVLPGQQRSIGQLLAGLSDPASVTMVAETW
ncbi:MAG: 2-amino-4-hydroxy-6-hydroxymethyldihydropteridine diphosphokinase [Chthoniobacteraceae bacterium]